MVNFCPTCGKQLTYENAEICPNCGVRIQNLSSNQKIEEEKNPVLAALCSIFPGLGQVYNGETALGVAVFFGTIVGALFFLIPGLIVWIFGIYNAYTVATKMNSGEIPFKTTKTAHMLIFFILAMFISILVIGFIILAAFAAFLTSFTYPIKITCLLI
jgi:TM2 domain-containing membrane protein YozV